MDSAIHLFNNWGLEDRLPFILQKFYSAWLFCRQQLCAHEEVFQLLFSPLSKTRLYLAPIKDNFLRKLSLPRSVVRQTISKPNKPANSVCRFIIGPSPLHAICKPPVKTTENDSNYAIGRFENHQDVTRYPGHQRSFLACGGLFAVAVVVTETGKRARKVLTVQGKRL